MATDHVKLARVAAAIEKLRAQAVALEKPLLAYLLEIAAQEARDELELTDEAKADRR